MTSSPGSMKPMNALSMPEGGLLCLERLEAVEVEVLAFRGNGNGCFDNYFGRRWEETHPHWHQS